MCGYRRCARAMHCGLRETADSCGERAGLGGCRRSAHALRGHVCPRTPCLDNTEDTSVLGLTAEYWLLRYLRTGGKPPVTPPKQPMPAAPVPSCSTSTRSRWVQRHRFAAPEHGPAAGLTSAAPKSAPSYRLVACQHPRSSSLMALARHSAAPGGQAFDGAGAPACCAARSVRR